MSINETFLENEQARLLFRWIEKNKKIGDKNVFMKKGLVSRPVYLVPLNLLRYNDSNFRIRHQVDFKVESEGISLIEEDNDDQSWIEDILSTEDLVENTALIKSIQKNGQSEPVIVRLSDSVVVDGNRRVMTFNKLVKNGEDKFKLIEAIIIEDELTDTEWIEMEARYQYEKDAKSHYDNINEAKMLKKLFDIYRDYEAVALRVNSKRSHVELRISTLSLIDSYLDKLDCKNNYSKNMIPSFTLFEELAKEIKKEESLSPKELHELEVTGLNIITLKSVLNLDETDDYSNGDVSIDDRTFRKLLKTFSLEPAKATLTQTVKSNILLNHIEMKNVKSEYGKDVSTAILIFDAQKQAKEPLRMINLAISHLKSIQNLKENPRRPIVDAIGDVTKELSRIRQLLLNDQV